MSTGGAHLEPLREAARLIEGDRSRSEVTVEVVEVGRGNRRDNRYYSSAVLESAARSFTNAQMYGDHLTPEAEKNLAGTPRSIWELAGRIRESWWEPTGGSDGQGAIRARASVVHPGLWNIIENDPELIGLSINALGRTRKGQAPDGREASLVESIDVVHSVDWVARAGAGGKIVNLLEADYDTGGDVAPEIDWSQITADDLRSNAPALAEAIADEAIEDFTRKIEELSPEELAALAGDEDDAEDEEYDETAEEEAEEPEAEPEGEEAEGEMVSAREGDRVFSEADVEDILRAAIPRIRKQVQGEINASNRRRDNAVAAAGKLAESGLPPKTQKRLLQSFKEFDGSEQALDKAVGETITEARAEIAEYRGSRGMRGSSGPSPRDRITEAETANGGTRRTGSSEHDSLLSRMGLPAEPL
jgi:hypothetical protein